MFVFKNLMIVTIFVSKDFISSYATEQSTFLDALFKNKVFLVVIAKRYVHDKL